MTTLEVIEQVAEALTPEERRSLIAYLQKLEAAPEVTPMQKRTPGLFSGFWMSEDFNDELPDSFWLGEDE